MKLTLKRGFWPSGVIFCALFTFAGMACAGTYSGGTGTAEDPYKIGTVADWQELGQTSADWGKSFILLNDIDFGGSSIPSVGWISLVSGPDYIEGTPFTGKFNGYGHIFRNGSVGRGLFDYIGNGSWIQNLGLENTHASGTYTGSMCGVNNGGTITECFVTGTLGKVTVFGAGGYIGGLCGINRGLISDCFTAIPVTGTGELYCFGGICGMNQGTISRCFASGQISGFLYLGGLCGMNKGTIQDCYATGPVGEEFSFYVGGLCGWNEGGTIHNCFAIGTVIGDSSLGGLCGRDDCVGWPICFSGIDRCYWDMETSGQATSDGGTGKTTAEMKTQSTFTDAGCDFKNTWAICEGTNYPRLRWQIPVTDWVCPDGVSLEDLVYLAGRWMAGTPETIGAADGNGDGRVDLGDFEILASHWMRM